MTWELAQFGKYQQSPLQACGGAQAKEVGE